MAFINLYRVRQLTEGSGNSIPIINENSLDDLNSSAPMPHSVIDAGKEQVTVLFIAPLSLTFAYGNDKIPS